jgi:hypothetical protein
MLLLIFSRTTGLANDNLKAAEDKLLEFNKASNIINYYEQSKAVAVVKEDMELTTIKWLN